MGHPWLSLHPASHMSRERLEIASSVAMPRDRRVRVQYPVDAFQNFDVGARCNLLLLAYCRRLNHTQWRISDSDHGPGNSPPCKSN